MQFSSQNWALKSFKLVCEDQTALMDRDHRKESVHCKFMTDVWFLVDVCGCDMVWNKPVVFLDSPSGVSCMQVNVWRMSEF